jgi:hypothetical protein
MLDDRALARLADAEARFALVLRPTPRDPVRNLAESHRLARPYLERLLSHDPAVEVIVNADGYSYTPRKVLRRVLDHALDHLNQIDQWRAWRETGTAPTPTDGWASSLVTFAEDRVPIDQAELDAWLWRIDLVIGMVAERARTLSTAELDWIPPDGSWTLRQTLNHLAAAELYYVRWLDEALPDNATERYTTASAMVADALPIALDAASEPNVAFAHANNTDPGHCAPEEIAEQILAQEAALLDA